MTKVLQLGEGGDQRLFSGSSCAFGVFDGVHAGHRFLISKARESAFEDGAASVVLTFNIDPDEVFAPKRLLKLMTNDERLAALAASGVDAVAVLDFTSDFAALSPEEFLDRTFGGGAPAHLHVGEGFRFGSRGSGDVTLLKEWGARCGMQVHCHDLYQIGGKPVSSTRIRKLLAEGALEEAEILLNG